MERVVVETADPVRFVTALLVAALIGSAFAGTDFAGVLVEGVAFVDIESEEDEGEAEEESGVGDGDAEESLAAGLPAEGGVDEGAVLQLGEGHLLID